MGGATTRQALSISANGYKGPSEISHQKAGPNDEIPTISASDREALLDYLHGDVVPDQDLAACAGWEYSRRDTMHLLEFARKRSNLPRGTADQKRYLWAPASYPRANWRDLTNQRQQLLRKFFWSPEPLTLNSCGDADQVGVLDEFKLRAGDRGRRRQLAVFKGFGSSIQVLVTLNSTSSASDIAEGLKVWLQRSGEVQLSQPKQGRGKAKADLWKRALHDLAIWRLDDWIGFEAAKQWTSENRRSALQRIVSKADPLKARRKVGPKVFWGHKNKVGPVYGDRRDWDKAIENAKDFLRAHFGEQLLKIVPAETRNPQSAPHFYHLGPKPMQIESVEVSVIRQFNAWPELREGVTVVPAEQHLSGIGPEERTWIGRYNGKLCQFDDETPGLLTIRELPG